MSHLAPGRNARRTALMVASLVAVPLGAQAPAIAAKLPATSAGFSAPAGSNLVTVVAREYAFVMPDTIPAGLTTIRLRDEGSQAHHLFLARLDSGRTIADFAATMRSHENPPAWMHFEGGPNTPLPGGGESYTTLDLAPGTYVAFCVIPAPDAMPHVAKGMMRQFVVAPSPRTAPEPVSDVSITLTDYAFTFSHPLTAGRHTIQVKNAGPQDHELVFMRMPPRATIEQMAAWAEKPNGPPPLVPWGGITDIAAGRTMYMHVVLEPGDYALICFVPDVGDGKPHVAHGMGRKIPVL